MEKVIGYATQACERIHCRFVLEIWPEVQSAIDLAEGYHAEAAAVGGPTTSAVFMTNYVQFANATAGTALRGNYHEWAELMATNCTPMKLRAAQPLAVSLDDVMADLP